MCARVFTKWVAAVVVGCPLASASAQAPATIRLTGVVRDFQASHADFGVDPTWEAGHRANLADMTLGPNQRPIRDQPAGFIVATQWRDLTSNPIPPHLYLDPASGGGGGDDTVEVEQGPQYSNSPTVDTFDSTQGPYPAGLGPAPTFDTSTPIPSISPPSGLPYQDKYEKAGGLHTLSSSLECKEFIVKDGARVRILGHVVVRANEKVDIINQAHIQIMPDSSFTLWAGKDFQITDEAQVNVNTADPTLCTINYWAGNSNTFKLQNLADVYAHFVSPDADLLIQDGSELYGSYTGRKLIMQNNAGYHHDGGGGGGAPEVCGLATNDSAGTDGGPSSAAITSDASFDEWFVDAMGTNLSINHTIVLTDNGSGVFEYTSSTFHPIDHQLFGNEGDAYNANFTFTFATTFTFTECTDMFFEFEGDDDCWVYVDDDLALDLGGITPGTPQRVDLDRMELTDGQTYTFRFFYANRQSDRSRFRIATNLPLQATLDQRVVSAGFD